MGTSGAGKTTLMDVIACRKTVGRVTGRVTANGRPLVGGLPWPLGALACAVWRAQAP